MLSSTKIISFNREGAVLSNTETSVLSSVDRGSFLYVMIRLIDGSRVPFSPLSRLHFLAVKQNEILRYLSGTKLKKEQKEYYEIHFGTNMRLPLQAVGRLSGTVLFAPI